MRHLLFLFFYIVTCSCQINKKQASINSDTAGNTITLIEDTVSLIRNPAMGWTLYDDAYDHTANAESYWAKQDAAARKYASIFYLRWRWTDLEPEEGKYAWIYNENFKKLIKGALDRNLKLAFRVFFDSRDMSYGSTPQYVRDAGAQGYFNKNNASLWSPYPEDPVFRQKFDKFLTAFAAEFNNPATVDYIDGHGLGLWGEGWNVITKTNPTGNAVDKDSSYNEVFEWMLAAYAKKFDKVLLCFNFNDMDWEMQKAVGVDKYGFVLRRDGLGGDSYPDERNYVHSVFPNVCFFGEAHYWFIGRPWNPTFQPFRSDGIYGDNGNKQYKKWIDVYQQTVDDALKAHANTLDMREEGETEGLLAEAPGLVQQFMLKGGYRFFPTFLSFPKKLKSGTSSNISYTIANRGVGVCPNNNIRWGFKYKPAFALIDPVSKVVKKVFADHVAEPSAWLQNKDVQNSLNVDLTNVVKGQYLLGLAIVNTTNGNTPEINLAVKSGRKVGGWIILNEIIVE